jgi:hypothetical protein
MKSLMTTCALFIFVNTVPVPVYAESSACQAVKREVTVLAKKYTEDIAFLVGMSKVPNCNELSDIYKFHQRIHALLVRAHQACPPSYLKDLSCGPECHAAVLETKRVKYLQMCTS